MDLTNHSHESLPRHSVVIVNSFSFGSSQFTSRLCLSFLQHLDLKNTLLLVPHLLLPYAIFIFPDAPPSTLQLAMFFDACHLPSNMTLPFLRALSHRKNKPFSASPRPIYVCIYHIRILHTCAIYSGEGGKMLLLDMMILFIYPLQSYEQEPCMQHH